MPGYGFAGHVGFAPEASGGTPVAANDYVEAWSENFALQLERFQKINIFGRYSEPDDQTGVSRVQGELAFAFHPVVGGHFLKGVFGQNSIAEVASGTLWRHDFTLAQEDWDRRFAMPPYTFEVFRDVTSAQQYAGTCMSQIQMQIQPNQDMRATVMMIGISETDIERTTPTYVTSPTHQFAFDTCSISLGGAGFAEIEALTITLNNNLEGIPTLWNSTNIYKIRRTDVPMVRIAGTLAFEDITEVAKYRAQTEQALTISVFRQNSFSLVFDLPRFVYSAFPLGMQGRERQLVEFEGIGRYHQGSATSLMARLTTTQSYY